MTFEPTAEQNLITAFARDRKESLVVNALAGAAKTTTLMMLAQEIKGPALALAFNSRIKKELEKKLPSNVTCKTLNGLGHSAWQSFIRRGLVVDTQKNGKILREILKELEISLDREEYIQMLDLCASAKCIGLVPKECTRHHLGQTADTPEAWKRMCVDVDLEPTETTIALAKKVLLQGIEMAFLGQIDFDDQIYMSICFQANYPKYPVVLVDEAQDLSPMNHKQVERACELNARVFIVGDRHQSIYAFRGADPTSIDKLAARFRCEELELTTTFRCDRAICDIVRKHVPGIKPRDNAGAGLVKHLEEWRLTSLSAGEGTIAVLCRNNAPLLTVASRLIRNRIGCKVLGRDVGKSLARVMAKFDVSSRGDPLLVLVHRYFENELSKAKDNDSKVARLADQLECIESLCTENPDYTSGQIAELILEMFADKNALITLATGHKSKGLEWDTVFHLDPWRVPSARAKDSEDPAQMVQEYNLQYVINTRAKHNLFFINMREYVLQEKAA